MKTAHELNAPLHATHYRAVNGVATYFHIDNAIFKYDGIYGWVELDEPVVIRDLMEIGE